MTRTRPDGSPPLLPFDLLEEVRRLAPGVREATLFTPEFGERFWARVERGEAQSCWEWQGTLSDGYGHVRVMGRMVAAHRVAYLLTGHTIPDGLVLDHLCRNRRCVNPAHLEAISNRENILRGEGAGARAARRMFCPRGHWYGGANLRVRGDGRRVCRTCERERRAAGRRGAR